MTRNATALIILFALFVTGLASVAQADECGFTYQRDVFEVGIDNPGETRYLDTIVTSEWDGQTFNVIATVNNPESFREGSNVILASSSGGSLILSNVESETFTSTSGPLLMGGFVDIAVQAAGVFSADLTLEFTCQPSPSTTTTTETTTPPSSTTTTEQPTTTTTPVSTTSTTIPPVTISTLPFTGARENMIGGAILAVVVGGILIAGSYSSRDRA